MLKLTPLAYSFRVTSKAKIYKKPLYQAIPFYHKPHYIDIHNGYKYRSKEEVLAQLRSLQMPIQMTRHVYPDIDPHQHVKNRKIILEFDVKVFQFTHLQMERFKLLMGSRLDEKTGKVKMVCEMFPEFEQNKDKIFEQLNQVLLESKRAP